MIGCSEFVWGVRVTKFLNEEDRARRREKGLYDAAEVLYKPKRLMPVGEPMRDPKHARKTLDVPTQEQIDAAMCDAMGYYMTHMCDFGVGDCGDQAAEAHCISD